MSVYLVCFHLIPDKSLRACNKPQPCGDRKMGQAKKPPHTGPQCLLFWCKTGARSRPTATPRPPFFPAVAGRKPAGRRIARGGGRAAQAAGQGGTEAQELHDLNLQGRQRTDSEWPGARDSDWRRAAAGGRRAGPGERAIAGTAERRIWRHR
jgi:hypothetical protein